jgi:MFS family permease
LIALVTVCSFEALGITTAMPSATEDLNGQRWYGFAFACLMLGQLIGTALSGVEIDAVGPKRAFHLGLGFLLVGLVAGTLAPHISVLLLSRFLVGLGAGGLFTVSYASVGLGYPEAMRSKVLAATSSAWVVPGLVGPVIAGWVTDVWTWRAVFAGVIPIAIVAGFVVSPVLTFGSPESSSPVEGQDRLAQFWSMTGQRRVWLSVLMAVGAATIAVGFQQALVRGAAIAAVGLCLIGFTIRQGLLPADIMKAGRGLSATILSTGFLIAAYSGTESFLPLALQRLRGMSPGAAGVGISIGSVLWFVGSWAHGRNPQRLQRLGVARGAMMILALGIMAVGALAWPPFPLALTFVAWGVAAFGMGLIYNLCAERPFQLVETDRIGVASAAVQTANSLLSSIITGAGGAVVAWLGTPRANGDVDITGRGIAWVSVICLASLAVTFLCIPRMLQPNES